MIENHTHRVAALLERLCRLVTMSAHSEGLLPVQWEALRYLGKANRFSRTPSALTAYLGITKGTVSQTLNALQSKGLIEKQADSRDRRSKLLSLTKAGTALLERDPLDQTAAAVEALQPSEQKDLAQHLQALLTQWLLTQNRQMFGQCRDCRYFMPDHEQGGPHYCGLLQEKLAESDAQAICHEQVAAG